MMRALHLSILFLLVQNAFGDPGTSHIIKAKISFQGEEHVGYFQVWGYLYLTSDSIKYDVQKFTHQAKGWVYGDTINFYSEIISMKDRDLIIFPADKFMRISKKNIKAIYPQELIRHNQWNYCYTRVQAIDREWIFNCVQTEREMIIQGDDLCTYSVLYFKKPDSVSTDLVRVLESEIRKGFTSGKDNSANTTPLIDQLKKLKVLILTHCSPS
ncbi:MAG TPA: hypothetical protein VIT44_09500 [Cyclobacteriaceae bacterium]